MHSLKTILIAAGVAAVVAGPAFAKSHSHVQAQQAAAASTAVVAPDGRVLGADPDVNIRAQLLRDYPALEGAN